LEDLKVFFNQQHDCDMLEKRILDNNGKNKNKKQKTTKNVKRTTTTTMPTRSAKAIESPTRSRNASIVAKSGISTTIAGLWKRTRGSGRRIIVPQTQSPRSQKWLWQLVWQTPQHSSPKNNFR
jgi:hypothetical protein